MSLEASRFRDMRGPYRPDEAYHLCYRNIYQQLYQLIRDVDVWIDRSHSVDLAYRSCHFAFRLIVDLIFALARH